ncbi:hypothetical protein [uncultured Phocaeicola sp.]
MNPSSVNVEPAPSDEEPMSSVVQPVPSATRYDLYGWAARL